MSRDAVSYRHRVPSTRLPDPARPHLVALDVAAALAVTAVYAGFAAGGGGDGAPAFAGPVWLVAGAVGLPRAAAYR